MNITYWLVVCVLLACAFLFIIPPLWKKREITETDSEHRNIKIAKDRANDLKQQLKAGALTQSQFDEQYEELELNLGDDLETDQLNEHQASQGRWFILVVVILVPLVSVLTYYALGEPDALKKAQAQLAQQSAQPTQQDINNMVDGLAQRLKREPDDAEGWMMLGRSYKYMGKYQLAVDAYEQAYQLLGDQTELMLHYADALSMANQGNLSGKAAELIFKALKQSPDNAMALWLGGMAKVAMGDNTQAMQYWRKLETILPEGSDSLRQLQGMMASLQAQNPALATQAESTVRPTKKESGTEISIEVKVSVNKVLESKVNATDTVFIYAKALTGPPMPLAIVRKKVADLPVTVVLDDAMAMMPAMKLSNFKQVKVMARVSKSGTAMQQKGDYIGSLELQDLEGKKVVDIVINQEI